MLYFVGNGDTLYSIARRFNVIVQDILNANVICNPNIIFPGQPLIIPESNHSNHELLKAGGHPYYIVLPGDSLYCIAAQLNTTVDNLIEGNDIKNPDLIYPGTELLITYDIPVPEELFNTWKSTGDKYCGQMSSLQIHGIYYIGTFLWQALGYKGMTYLTKLLNHPCPEVRFFTVLSLGRIADGDKVIWSLTQMLKDPDESVVNIATLALKRIRLVKDIGKRVHVTIGENNRLFVNPVYTSPFVLLHEGTPVIVMKWRIPSPTGEEGPVGGIQIYDYVQVLSTGQVGFLPRLGYDEIVMI
ncbi:MAG TPA: LysM peptidoglycan-binding domain-containing protein [Clostridiaceae bacterium]|nr:LysM peptidoglycan-binding domain-containing protein [Clostridiaceae bacterium]